MSEPVSKDDIEDVLASIRRLVSNGTEQERAKPDDENEAGRLVLAPSQRVDAPDEPEPATPDAARATSPETTADDEADAMQPARGAEPAPDPETHPEPLTAPEPEATAEEVSTRDLSESAAGDGAAGPEAWEPDGDDEDAFAEGADAPTLEWRDIDEEGAQDAPSVDPDEMDADEAASAAFARDWDDGARATKETTRATPLDIDEAVLDEEALRDLVAEIVREELMGTLGERITRNVRKLVRREIHRALTCQDFD